MAIVAVSRWQIDPEQVRELMQESAPLMRQHGAQSATIGVIRTGPQSGQTTVTVSFATWEAFGLAMAASATDGAYQALAAQMRQHGQLLDRFLLTEDDLELG
jgi:hypothetical protein